MKKNRAGVRARLWEGIKMKSIEDLDVFKLAHQLALKTYSTTFRDSRNVEVSRRITK